MEIAQAHSAFERDGADMQEREPRRQVVLNARMRLGQSWSDVVIRDLSSRGMRLSCTAPPPPGAYLEICGPATTLVARTIWVREEQFGVRIQDRIDVESVLTAGRLRAAAAPIVRVRPVRPADREQSHAESRHRASAAEYAAALIFILIAATTAAILLHSLFALPLQRVASSLGAS
ncbi:PilZ domain-containing protein [Sphingomonas sp. LB-2]|uniref:PilZ domain-containing protein n=1 Tax=Sphingomonas caeni TaxID=2984949 RepID=UPI0022315928|nr:PilZ domain-containing protein [Sphingomonas caeni]MCW3849312.1 PilZ domain-containing protein [Sphingomonas caeni]